MFGRSGREKEDPTQNRDNVDDQPEKPCGSDFQIFPLTTRALYVLIPHGPVVDTCTTMYVGEGWSCKRLGARVTNPKRSYIHWHDRVTGPGPGSA